MRGHPLCGCLAPHAVLKTDADKRINALARLKSEPETAADRPLIQDRLERARFAPDRRPAGEWTLLGYSILGLDHPDQPGVKIVEATSLSSAEVHVLKRIQEGNWLHGTTPAEFVQDLGSAMRHPAAWLVVGVENGHAQAGCMTGSQEVGLIMKKCNTSKDMCVVVVYDASESFLSTGFLRHTRTARRFADRWIPVRELGKISPPRP